MSELQSQIAECGLACLAYVAKAYNHHLKLSELRQKFPGSIAGSTLNSILKNATTLGFLTRAVRLEPAQLNSLKLPCILHWRFNHFVVLQNIKARHIVIFDPSVGKRRVSFKSLSEDFTGVAVEIWPAPSFTPKKAAPNLRVRELTGAIPGIARGLFLIFIVTGAVQLLALGAPLLQQLILDDAIASGDTELLKILLIGFSILLVVQTLTSWARTWMVAVFSQSIGMRWSSNIFSHLLRLPAEYFEARHLGDISSKFAAINSIQRTVTTRAVESLLDGCFVLAILTAMMLYSARLTIIALFAFFIYSMVRFASYYPLRTIATDRLIISSQEHSFFLESIRAIKPIKLFARETDRHVRWQNIFVELQNHDFKAASIGMRVSSTASFIFGMEMLLTLYFGANLVVKSQYATGDENFTIGMLFAFLGYKLQFQSRLVALVDFAIEFSMLKVHTLRLADIALTPKESINDYEELFDNIEPVIELSNIGFRYSDDSPWVFRNLNLRIQAGESVAITGSSGCGKSTLVKILLGLIKPQEGHIFLGGIELSDKTKAAARRIIGAVLQNDSMLAGSLAENISFFDSMNNLAWVKECAELAQIHKEIINLPMGYNTLVGDLGSGLSGGQAQRLLLARALYKKPKILLMDEATSHLDAYNDRQIAKSIKSLNTTRLIIAHRSETTDACERVMILKNGQLEEIRGS